MIDLRKHFGIWKRCGNTRFFRKDPENPWRITYVNPLDGVLVEARRENAELSSEPRWTLVVRDGIRIDEKAAAEVAAGLPRWINRAVVQFFTNRAYGWVQHELLRRAGRDPVGGDEDLRFFVKVYRPSGPKYHQTGSSSDLGDPALEELLEGIYRILSLSVKATADYGRGLSSADVEEALAQHGLLECE